MENNEDFIYITNEDIKKLKQHYWDLGDLDWKLDGLQRRISKTVKELPDAKKICILSSRQIGKSYWCIVYALEFLINNPNKIARVVAPTLSGCHNIVKDNLAVIAIDAPDGFLEKNRSEMCWKLPNGSSLRLGALESAHVDTMNRGGNASLIIYEECGFVRSDDFLYGVNSVFGPQLLRSKGRELFISSPPQDPDHALVTQVKPSCEALGTFFRFSVFDSPTIDNDQILEAARRSECKLTDEFIQEVESSGITSLNVHEVADRTGAKLSEAFRREFLAEIIRPSSLMVVPDFSDTHKHVLPFHSPAVCSWSITIDWGGVRDKTCAILHTYDYLANLDLVRDEKVFEPNTSTSAIVSALVDDWHSEYKIDNVYADVPGQTQVDLNALGYFVSLPQKSDWLSSVQTLAARFTTDKILIDPRCKFIRNSLRSGMFNKARTDFERSESLGHCDGLAALMYAIRCQNKSNPYDLDRNFHSNTMFVMPKTMKRPESEVAALLSPKQFGRFHNG